MSELIAHIAEDLRTCSCRGCSLAAAKHLREIAEELEATDLVDVAIAA